MVSTRWKDASSALARKEVSTQTELSGKDAAIQVSGCRECHQLALEIDGSGENSCVRCAQLDYLLGLVTDLRDEVDSLRNIRESEREIDWWSHALTSPKPEQGQPPEKGCHQRDPVSSSHQDVGRDLKEAERGKKSAIGATSEPSPCPPYVSRCLCTVGVRLCL